MDKWPRRPVKDLCKIIVDCVNRTAPIVDGPTPFRMIRTTNVRDGRIDLSTCRYVDEPTYERWTRRAKVLDGDVILTREAPIGEVAYVQNLGPVFLGQRIMQYRPDPTVISPRYLYYAFRSSELQHQFGSHEGSGSVVSHIRVADCHEFKVPVPPRRDQDAIATLIGALDDKIELNRRMNETLEAMAQAIFRDWFVDFGPTRRKLAGTTEAVDIMGGLVQDSTRAAGLAALLPAGFGDNGLPTGWTEQPLLKAAHLISGGTPKTDVADYWNGTIPWASAKDVSQCGALFLLNSERCITKRGLEESSTKMVPAMATVVVARGATTGRYCMFGSDMAMNQTCYALASESGHPVWLHLAFGTLVERLINAAHGSVFDTITTTTLQSVSIVDPGLTLISACESLVSALYLKALANSAENQTLAAMRDLLLPKLMSGEIRLRDAEALVEAAS